MSTVDCSLSIRLPKDLAQVVRRKDILLAFFELINHDIAKVDIISQQLSNFIWRITFEEGYDTKFLVGKTIKLENKEIQIEDFNEISRYRFMNYKVMWLPHKFSKEKIESFFKVKTVKDIEVKEEVISEKIDLIPNMPDLKIKTGNFFVKIKLKKEDEGVPIKTGLNEIEKNRVFISLKGEKPKCLKCNNIGHIRKNCPLNNIFCISCKKSGHKVENCTLALRTKLQNDNLPDEDDTIDDIENMDVNNIEKNYENTIAHNVALNYKAQIETKKRKAVEESPKNYVENQEVSKKIEDDGVFTVDNQEKIPIGDITVNSFSEYSESEKL